MHVYMYRDVCVYGKGQQFQKLASYVDYHRLSLLPNMFGHI